MHVFFGRADYVGPLVHDMLLTDFESISNIPADIRRMAADAIRAGAPDYSFTMYGQPYIVARSGRV